MTAHTIQEERNTIIANGVNGLLTKPVDEDTLLNCVKNYRHKRLLIIIFCN